MKLPTRRWFVLIAGVTIFLAAFGIAFAATWTQGSKVVPSALNVQPTIVISGDEMFALWRDEAMTEPVISGDGPHVTFLKVETQPPLRELNFARTPPIFIQNVSSTLIRPIEPCHEVIIGGQPVGTVSAHLRTLGSKEQNRGNTCDDGRIGEMMSPGEKWMIHINLELKQPLPEGDKLFDLLIGGIGVTGDVPTPIAPPADLVSWWPGDGNASDIMDGNHGTLLGGATFTGGKVGQAFSLDGVDDFVQIANTPTMDFGTGDFTIDLWVNLESLSKDQEFLHKTVGSVPNNTNKTYFVEFNTPNSLRFRVSDISTNVNDLIVPVSLVAGRWYHIAAVRAGDTNSIYLDGALIGTQTAGSNVDTGSGGFARIGQIAPNGVSGIDRHVHGLIDEVEAFNRALTDAEIRGIFEAGSAGKIKPPGIAPPTGMVSWWPGDGNASDIVDGNHGTLQGGATFTTSGKVGQAFSLDGVDDVVSTPLTVSYGDGVTFDAWVKTTGDVGPIVTDGGGATAERGMGLFVQPPGKLFLFGTNGTGNLNFLVTGDSISDGAFHHVAATWTGNAATDGVKLYIDGALVATATALTPIGTGSTPIHIGGHTTIAHRKLAGLIDEVELFDRVLSEAEIRAIFDAGSAGKRKP